MNTDIGKNQQLFKKEWDTIYHSKDSKLVMVGNVEGYKIRKEGSHYIVFNKTRAQKRDKTVDKGTKSVFMPFDPLKFNFCNISNKQIIFHVNLDEQAIISKQQAHKITQKFFDKEQGGQDDQIQSHTHPLIINTAPVCKYHSLLAMYPDEQLPQVVGSDILLLLLNIFRILPNSKVGYNSIGAAASVNNLHFHVLYSEELIQNNKMPIQTAEKKLWLKSSLQNPQQQINLYSIGVCIEEIASSGVLAFVLRPYKKQGQTIEYAQLTNSLSFVFGIIANELIQLNIPHNLLISDNGQSIYIFVRDFDDKYGWLEYSGVVVATDEKQFQIKEAEIIAKKKTLQIDGKTIQILKNNIKKHLSKFN